MEYIQLYGGEVGADSVEKGWLIYDIPTSLDESALNIKGEWEVGYNGEAIAKWE